MQSVNYMQTQSELHVNIVGRNTETGQVKYNFITR